MGVLTPTSHANWDRSSYRDPLSNTVTDGSTLTSRPLGALSFPYAGRNRARLSLSEHGDRIYVFVDVDRGILRCGNSCRVRIKIDDQEAVTIEATQPRGDQHDRLLLYADDDTIYAIARSKKILVELDFYRDGTRIAQFATQKPAQLRRATAARLSEQAATAQISRLLSATDHKCYELDPQARNDCIDAVRACLSRTQSTTECAKIK
jgi:hypothetical protein